jgi:IS30 family transposase
MEKSRKRLTLKERIVIETLLKENKSKTYIANQLDRNRSSITREINNWIRKPSDKYDANLAHWYAREINNNKRCQDKINTYPRLKMFVYRGLLKGTTPELIAGQIKIKYPNDPVMTISYEAIYQHIYRHRQSYLAKKLIKLLPYHHHKRRNKRKFNKNTTRIKDQVSIDNRPEHIEQRLEVGHWEGDLMIGVGQKSAIATLVERKTRYTIVMKIQNRKSKTVTKEFADSLNNLSKIFRKSMTYDNGIEMANHKWLANQTGINIYFAHPYSSWERGTNENTNGLIRRFFPKGTDFNQITLKQLKDAQNNLNDRPRKVLGFKTPNEKMNDEIINVADDVGGLISGITFAKSYSENKALFN